MDVVLLPPSPVQSHSPKLILSALFVLPLFPEEEGSGRAAQKAVFSPPVYPSQLLRICPCGYLIIWLLSLERLSSGATLPGFKSPLYHLLAEQPWTCHLSQIPNL